MMLNIIIPTLNAEQTLQATLDSCRIGGASARIIVSDGGSVDSTLAIAERNNCLVVSGVCGRGVQLARGAATAANEGSTDDNDWMLFLHGDSRLPDDWFHHVSAFVARRTNTFHAATFHLKLDDDCPQARRIERLVAWRTCFLALPYGDQGLLISRVFHDRLGGFRPIPIMEDVDMVRRIGRAGLRVLDTAITTSARKYRRDGYWKRPLKNLCLVCLYQLGVPATKLAEYYR